MVKYKRILLKFSGEALMGQGESIDTTKLNFFAAEIKKAVDEGVQVGLVIGGGNIFRGLKGMNKGFDRVKGDQMGMLATVINALAFQSALQAMGTPAQVFTAIRMEPVGEGYSKDNVIEAMRAGKVAILAAGTGNPYFTTDTAASLRAVELEVDLLLKGTKVDGIYTADPVKDAAAKKYDALTFDEAYQKNLQIMDLTAFTMCRENNLPLIVFNMSGADNLKNIIFGQKVGTLVTNG